MEFRKNDSVSDLLCPLAVLLPARNVAARGKGLVISSSNATQEFVRFQIHGKLSLTVHIRWLADSFLFSLFVTMCC